jgi:protein-tyrosine phosphatase
LVHNAIKAFWKKLCQYFISEENMKAENKKSGPKRLLFVCTGNICRSPTAEGVLRKYAQDQGLEAEIVIDSAATHDYHPGSPPDPRTIAIARERGYDLSSLRARKVTLKDFEDFDLLFAMDQSHARFLKDMAPAGQEHKIALLLEYAEHPSQKDVPDPYYHDLKKFTEVIELIENITPNLVRKLLS